LHALGPVLAFEPPDETGLVYDDQDWAIEAQGEQLVVTSRASRACSVVRLPTGVKGRVEGGRVVVTA
jgi:hypothetical protein